MSCLPTFKFWDVFCKDRRRTLLRFLCAEAWLTFFNRMLTTVPFWVHPARRKRLCRPRKLCRDLVSLYARGHLAEPQEVLELVTTKLLCSSDAKLIFKAASFLDITILHPHTRLGVLILHNKVFIQQW